MPKSKKSQRKVAQQPKPAARKKVSRRELLRSAPILAIGVLAVLGVGYWGFSSVTGAMAEQDLSVVGSGMPTIVQVHDPACAPCLALQRETRAALSTMDDEALGYRVANINTPEGLAFATEHGASYTTLLFFDGAGNVARRIVGETPRDALRAAFLAHVAAK